MQIINSQHGKFNISTDATLLNVDYIHKYLSTASYWAKGISKPTVENSIAHSLCFGVYHSGVQVGFARIVSDYATVAYLGDVFIDEAYRNLGLSKWLMETINTHPQLQGLRRWILLTADAHRLYEKFGWTQIASPDRWMERHFVNVYQNNG
jgi:GNAT superfamily N-acetyltransferase